MKSLEKKFKEGLEDLKKNRIRKIVYAMGEEKIEQNVERLSNFLFHTLGCGKEDTKKIINKFIKRYLNNGSRR